MDKLQLLSLVLWTKDLQATTRFYEDILGFKGESHFPNFVTLTRDKVQIMMIVPNGPDDCTIDEEPFFPKPQLTGSIYIFTEHVNELWGKIKDSATIKEPVADREYFMRDFSIYDNNGYELVFGEDIGRIN